MNFKIAFVASAMMAFAGVFTMVGCGGDEDTTPNPPAAPGAGGAGAGAGEGLS